MSKERLIDAERLKADLRGLYELAGWGEREVHFSLADMDCNIDMEDSVEAEPVRHGEWLEREDDYDWYVFCSECGDEYVEDKDLRIASWVKQYFNYCPYCGAKMDKRKKNEID